MKPKGAYTKRYESRGMYVFAEFIIPVISAIGGSVLAILVLKGLGLW